MHFQPFFFFFNNILTDVFSIKQVLNGDLILLIKLCYDYMYGQFIYILNMYYGSNIILHNIGFWLCFWLRRKSNVAYFFLKKKKAEMY